MNPVLQSSIDVSLRSVSPEARVFSYFVAAVTLVLVSYLVLKYRRPALDSQYARHAKTIRDQLETKTAQIGVYYRDVDEDDLDDLWTADSNHFARLRKGMSMALRKVSLAGSPLPVISIRFAQEAILTVIVGSLALVPTWWFARQVSKGPDYATPTIQSFIRRAEQFIDLVLNVLGQFPLAEVWFAFALKYAIDYGNFLYHNWKVVAAVLFAGAILTAVVERYFGVEPVAGPRPRRVTGWILSTGVLVWLVGTVLAFGVGQTTSEDLGLIVGLAGALLVLIGAVGWLVVLTVWRIWWTKPDLTALSYSGVRAVFALFGLSVLPIMLFWSITAMTRREDLVSVLAEASDTALVALLILGFLFVAAFAWRTRDGLVEIGVALRGIVADRAVRGAMFARGVPIIIFVAVFIWTSAMQLPALLVITAAVVFSVFSRLAAYALRKARYGLRGFTINTSVPWAIVELLVIEDADGKPLYAARINGSMGLMSRDRDDLTARTAENASIILQPRGLTEEVIVPDSLEERWYPMARDEGLVYEDEIRSRIEGEMMAEFYATVDEHDGDKPSVDEDMERSWPVQMYEDLKRELIANGSLSTYKTYELRDSRVFRGGGR
jgi:hypothetical protein